MVVKGLQDPVASHSQSGFSGSSMGIRLVPSSPVRMSDYMMVLQLGTIVVSRVNATACLGPLWAAWAFRNPWLLFMAKGFKILRPRKTSSRSFRKRDEGVKKEGRMLGAVAWDLSLVWPGSPTGVEALSKQACLHVLLPLFSQARAMLAA